MREPLNQFADRLLRGGELVEFLRGLVFEKGVDPAELIQHLERMQEEQRDDARQRLLHEWEPELPSFAITERPFGPGLSWHAPGDSFKGGR